MLVTSTALAATNAAKNTANAVKAQVATQAKVASYTGTVATAYIENNELRKANDAAVTAANSAESKAVLALADASGKQTSVDNAKTARDAALTAYTAADTALTADPTNTAKQATVVAAATTLQTASATLSTAEADGAVLISASDAAAAVSKAAAAASTAAG